MEDKDGLLKQAKKRLEAAWEYDRENREEAIQDLRFLALDQWPEAVRAQREKEGRPCLTLDHLNQSKNQVVNDIRQAKIGMKAVPVDSNSDPKIADIYTELMRDIQYRSHATHVFAKAADGCVSCGIGHFAIETGYAEDSETEQEIKIRHIPYPLAVYWDPGAVEPDRSDANWCLVVDFMPQDSFKEKWPDADPRSLDTPDEMYAGGIQWATKDGVLVADYWYKEGGVVKHALITGGDILEGPSDWAGRYIPIVPVIGTEIHLEKRTYRAGLIRGARDPQQLYNYWRSAAAELIALAPKAKWLATVKQIGTRIQEWATAHLSTKPYLMYEPDPKAPGVSPQLVPPPAPPQAIWQEAALVVDDMKAATGIYDASLGAKSNETSGVAIARRQNEGDVATYHFADNLERSLEHAGKILIDLIPKIYDTARVVRLMGDDDETRFEQVNQPTLAIDEQGMPIQYIMNDLTVGRYDISVSIGPSYTTQRLEAAESMVEYARLDPEAVPAIRDLIVMALDWPDAEKFAERLKRLVPPQALPPEEQQHPDQSANELAMKKEGAEIAKTEGEARKAHAQADQVEIENAITETQVDGFGVPPPDHALPPPTPQGNPSAPPSGVF